MMLLIVSIVFGGLFAYARTWPPIVAVESGSMMHSVDTSEIGAIDTGDIVIVQTVESRAEVVTYLEGRATGYTTYGDYGDVLVFRDPRELAGTAFIHRAFAYVVWNGTSGGYDIPHLGRLPAADWDAWDASDNPTTVTYGLSRFFLRQAGWRHDLDIHVNLTAGERPLSVGLGATGFLTLGDRNAYENPITKHDRWVVQPSYVLGKARGEIPWFGLIKLTFLREGPGCCEYWGSTHPDIGAPANSWLALDVSLGILIGAPIALTLLEFYLDRHPATRERWRSAWRRIWRRRRGGSEGDRSSEEEGEKKDENSNA